MPRNGSSVYSLPAGNPVIPGTVIATTWANTTLTDIATALTNSLSTDGSTASVSLAGKTMTGGTFSGPTVTSSLNLTGGQIAFPAVAVPSANANTLDDYEEGTWTPTLTYQTPGNLVVAYVTRIGVYTKIGALVSARFEIETSTFTHTTASGSQRVTGWPFNSPSGGTYGVISGAVFFSGWNLGTVISYAGNMSPASSIMLFSIFTTATPNVVTQLTTAAHTTGNNVILACSIAYEAP